MRSPSTAAGAPAHHTESPRISEDPGWPKIINKLKNNFFKAVRIVADGPGGQGCTHPLGACRALTGGRVGREWDWRRDEGGCYLLLETGAPRCPALEEESSLLPSPEPPCQQTVTPWSQLRLAAQRGTATCPGSHSRVATTSPVPPLEKTGSQLRTERDRP